MRKGMMGFLLLTLSFCISDVIAADTVVVIPLNKAPKELQNVVSVSASGADFTNPVAAVNSITDAAPSNPYLVIIGPGIYTLTETLVMKEYVSVVGAGELETTLTGEISTGAESTSAIISGASNTSLRRLTVKNTGGSDVSVAIYNRLSSPDMQDITAEASGGTIANQGIFNRSSSPTMSGVDVTATGGTYCYAISNTRNDVAEPVSSPLMQNVTATASGGGTTIGIHNTLNSSPTMTHVTATASGGTVNYAVKNDNSSPSMTSVSATASGGGTNIGVYITDSSPTLRRCTVDGSSFSIFLEGSGTTHVMQSSLLNSPGLDSGATATINCLYSDNGVDMVLSPSCIVSSP